MAQFDFPRLNFSGNCSIDPATANNGWYMPLVVFDPIRIEAVCPPRVYLESKYILGDKTLEDVIKVLPEDVNIQTEYEGQYSGVPYIEIEPINTDEMFKEWASQQLGKHHIDEEYYDIYKLVGANGEESIFGTVPGYWNYYGTMQYRYLDVSIKSAITDCSQGEYTLFSSKTNNNPTEVDALLGATLDMNNRLGDDSSNSAVMVDLLPTMAMYSQIFCDQFNITKDHDHILTGRPKKASLRVVNSFRVVNENMPQGASGVFFSVIPLEEMMPQQRNEVLQFFDKYRDKKRKLKGIFIQQMISEVEEIRLVDYETVGKISNPAFAKVGGTISPWYEEDMINWPACRQMNGVAPFLEHHSPKFMAPIAMMTPAVFKVDKDKNLLQLDFLNNFPVINTTTESTEPLEPRPDEENTYETYNLGTVQVLLDYKNERTGESEKIPLSSFEINNETWPRDKYYNDGGMIPIPLDGIENVTTEKIANGDVMMVWIKPDGNVSPLLAESPMIFTSEQCGMYTNVNDDPMRGFLSNSNERELCKLRIFKRGVPQTEPTPMSIIQIRMAFGGSTKSETVFRKEQYSDGDVLIFPNAAASNAIYLFTDKDVLDPLPPQYPLEVVGTGFYINLKVLPKHNYSKYFNPEHPEYVEKITFDILYKEIFRTYSLMTPIMRFNAKSWENEHLAQLLVEKTHEQNWASSRYMPVSRDMSADQIQLIHKWAEGFDKLEKNIPTPLLFQELKKLEGAEKLKQIQFFNK